MSDLPRAALAKTATTHLLSDSLAEYGEQEDGGDGRHHVTFHLVHVVKQLLTARRLDHRDPDDGDNE